MTDDTLYRVRPLEWEEVKLRDGTQYTARTPIGDYFFHRFHLGGVMTVYTPSGNTGEDVDFSNPKDAKRYAEAHYRERLTQCLIPHTTR